METSFHLCDELLGATAEDERASLCCWAAFEEIESFAADLALFKLFARAEMLRLNIRAGRGDTAACGLDDALEVIGRDAAGTEDVAVGKISVDEVNKSDSLQFET